MRWRVSLPIVVAWLLDHLLGLLVMASRRSLVGTLIGRWAWARRHPDGTVRQWVKLWVVLNLGLYLALRTVLIVGAAKLVQGYVWLRCAPLMPQLTLAQALWLWRYSLLNSRYRRKARRMLKRSRKRYPWAAGLYAVIAAPHGSADDLSALYDTKTKAWLGALITASGKPWFDVTAPQFGATGSGGTSTAAVTAETFAANAAITAAQGKGPVFWPKPAVAYILTTLTLLSGTVMLGFDLPQLKLANATNADLITFADQLQTDTQIIGLGLDGNGANQTANSDIVGFPGGAVACGFNRLVISANSLQNAWRHGIFLSEAAAAQSNNPKWVFHNTVNGHGLGGNGYGIYEDYCGNTINEGNFATNVGTFDCIELGHAGPGSLATLGSLTCVYNITKGGQINYPFSDNARIEGNFVLNSKISNDQNTANNVAVVGNTVWAPAATNQDTGIQNAGDSSLIEGNYVSVGQNRGIGNALGNLSNCRIQGNLVNSTNAGNSSHGIYPGNTGAGASDGNTVLGNVVGGHFVNGVTIVASNQEVASNRVNLSGATAGIQVFGSATSGIVANNVSVHDNNIAGAASALALPLPGTDAQVLGLEVRHNKGVPPPTQNGWASGLGVSVTAQAATVTILRLPIPNDGAKHIVKVAGGITITAIGTGSANWQVSYTDDGGTARTFNMPLASTAGVYAALANAADAWKGAAEIAVNPNQTVTVAIVGTFTGGFTYNASGVIELVS